MWINKSYCENLVLDGLRSLRLVYFKFLYEEKLQDAEEVNSPSSSGSETDDDGYFLDELMKDDEGLIDKNKEPEKYKIELELEREIKFLTDILSKPEALKGIKSNIVFWSKYKNEMPRLSRLAIVLLNINASSAFIERFFSICGIICKKQSGNMSDEMIITRSILKTNIEILKELNQSLI